MISKPLAFIHASLTLLLPLLLALLVTGCKGLFFSESDKNQKMDYGPKTSEREIQLAFAEALTDYDPNTMRVGEWVQLDQTQQLNGLTFLISDMLQTVKLQIDAVPGEVTFQVVENRRYFDRDLKVINSVDSEFGITFETESAIEAHTKKAGMFGDPLHRIQQMENELQQRSSDGSLTFHNLSKSTVEEPPPSAIANSPDCQTYYPGCKIRVYKIAYDMVYWENGKGDILHREYKISPDVPYLGLILSECLSGVLPVEKERVLVKECVVANDFRFGPEQ